MGQITAEQFAQRAFDLNLLSERELEVVWSELRTRDVPVADFRKLILRRELMTNYQCERLVKGERSGFFYGKYKVLYRVGTGTFARVYRAVHTETGRIVAVKVLRRRFSEEPDKTDQFLREGELGSSLRHPNIVPIYEVHSEGQLHYLTMEFVEGQNMSDFVKIRRKLEPEEAVRQITDVVAGLDYAFQRGVTHRDLKLSNILISSRGRAKLVDFGLAAVNEQMSDEALAAYPNPRTIDYAGLERATGVRKDDPRSDVYFTGCIFYHMLTGEPPLYETKDRVQRLSVTRFQDVTPIYELEPNLPSSVAMVVGRAMELNPNKRYANPGEMLEDLKLAAKNLNAPPVDLENPTPDEIAPVKTGPILEGTNKTILIVESHIPMQNVLREKLKDRGYRVLMFSDPMRAKQRLEEEPKLAHVIVLSSIKLGENALEAFNDFGTQDFAPCVLVVDEKQEMLLKRAVTSERNVVVSMPIRLGELRELLQKLVTLETSSL